MNNGAVLDPEIEGQEGGTDGLTEAERRAQAEGRKKHSRPVLTLVVDGQTVLGEKIWGSAIFPKDVVRDFSQYCRDKEVKSSEILEEIIRNGLAPVFEDVQATKADRDRIRAARKAAVKGVDLGKQAESLLRHRAREAAAMEAARATIAFMIAKGGDDAVEALQTAAVLGIDPKECVSPSEVEPTPVANGKRPKK